MRCMKVRSNGLADPARLQEAGARWLGELRSRKVYSDGLADPARLQEARARWLGELRSRKVYSDGLADPERHEGGGSADLRCKKATSHSLADTVRFQEPRARWLAELAVLESNLARVSRPDRVPRGTNEMVLELAVQESKLARVSRPGKVARGTREVARQTCVISHGLADPARLQEDRARWLGEHAVQEIKFARVSRPSKVARGTREVARQTCGARKQPRTA
ncbi:hypothetical protein CRG98_043738 [Punica granatum]|uniref:Uncharacterized protein n=1 Tax=Punica granatum TaxID=22663 RepID=A0A2I0HWI0_PUNGR|nr:hypothetical protein CRG98_043738 [Punica granatum]